MTRQAAAAGMKTRITRKDPRTLPAYTIAEASHYLGIPESTVRWWTVGRDSYPSLIEPASIEGRTVLLSFNNLVELHVLGVIRREHEVKMPKVRAAIDYLKRKMHTSSHPLLQHEMQTDGVDLFVDRLGALLGSATAISSGNLVTTGANQAQGVLGLRWRLFDFGRVDAQIAAARGQEAEALAAYRLAVLRATEEVENSFSALVKREAQVGILTQGESSLARARENSLAAYKGGVVSLIEVLNADGNLLQMRDEKAQAQAEAARAAISSFRALGGGWDARNASSNRYGALQ
jgi:hypothetical protein